MKTINFQQHASTMRAPHKTPNKDRQCIAKPYKAFKWHRAAKTYVNIKHKKLPKYFIFEIIFA